MASGASAVLQQSERAADHAAAPRRREPIRVVRVMTRLNIGGPALHAALLASRLDPRDVHTCLVVGRPERHEGDLAELVRQAPITFCRLRALGRAIRPWTDGLAFLGLLRILWRERPQVIHTHMAKAGALGRMAGLVYNRFAAGRDGRPRARLVHTFHGHVLEGYFPVWISRVFITIERWLAGRTDCLIAVSPSIQRALLAKGIGRPEQWRTIPLGLDLTPLADLPPPHDTPLRCGIVGRLVPIKNPGLWLQAMARLRRSPDAPRLEGLIVGDGPLRASLEEDVRTLHLQGTVRLTGWQHDRRAIYEGLAIVCLTSWNEGTPVSIIEAMAAGRTVIATDVGGVRDLLEETSAAAAIPPGGFQVAARGLLVRPGDVEGTAAALRAAATEDALRVQLAARARAYALATYTDQRLLWDLTALYTALAFERAA